MSGGGKSRNFRRRSDDDGDAGDNAPPPGPPPRARPPAASKSRSLLSFADEEETTSTTRISSRSPAVSSLSSRNSSLHRITTSRDRAAAPLPKASSLQSQTGEYTKEKLLELQKNARPLGSFPKPSALIGSSKPPLEPPPSRSEAVREPVIVLKGIESLIKTVAVQKEEAIPSTSSEIAGRELSELGISEEEKDSGPILDQATINAIRAKRERLRQARAAPPDFISLDSGGGTRKGGGSSDEEDHEFRGRILSAGAALDFSETIEEHEEEDDEERIWEEEQFRKGLGKVSVGKPDMAPQRPPAAPQTSIPVGYGVSRSADAMSLSQQAELAMRALREGIGKLKESNSRTVSSLAKTEENLSDALRNIADLEKSLAAAGEKFVFMQKLREFLSILCSFLQDKAPYIEELEEQMQKLRQDRADAIRERREADDADEMAEVESAINATSGRENSSLPVELDEFGRDLNLQKRLDRERRSESRRHRKARAESKIAAAIEGEASTDESENEAEAYASTRSELLQTAGLIFSDAAEDYQKLSSVARRLQEWKNLYTASYSDAYMSLSAPLIFAPYLRLELLNWDPLRGKSDFCDMSWHDELFNFGSSDQDSDLIPDLVEEVAVPALSQEIKLCWDVMSTKETENAVFATSMIISYLQPSSKKLTALMAEIVARLSDAAESIAVPEWSASVTRAIPQTARIVAHRFGRAVRLLKNICLWKDVVSPRIIQELAVDLVLRRRILPHLQSVGYLEDAVRRTERVVAAVVGAGVEVGKFGAVVEWVMEMGRELERREAAGMREDVAALARRLKKMLVMLDEYDLARGILRTFKLREAL